MATAGGSGGGARPPERRRRGNVDRRSDRVNRRRDDRRDRDDRDRRARADRRPAHRPADPQVSDDVTGRELDLTVRRELTGLAPQRADSVAKHLVMAGRLLDEDPETAYLHARAARALAARLGVVREAIAIAAYATGRYDEALAEFRAFRRIVGSTEHWPVMADCERGLGRPERALRMASAPEVQSLGPAGRAEMRIVAAGARRDLGEIEAAVATLQVPELNDPVRPWTARLRYAYADALHAAGHTEEAKEWFGRAAAADAEGEIGAADRLAELDGVTFLDDERS